LVNTSSMRSSGDWAHSPAHLGGQRPQPETWAQWEAPLDPPLGQLLESAGGEVLVSTEALADAAEARLVHPLQALRGFPHRLVHLAQHVPHSQLDTWILPRLLRKIAEHAEGEERS
jgi:hypothetical protein